MTTEETRKVEMLSHINSAIRYLEQSLSVVECDDAFNDGQSKVLNKIYKKVSNVVDELASLQNSPE